MKILFSPDQFPQGQFPAPLWKRAWSEIEPEIAATRNAWSAEINFESSQPPLYYALASGWWWMGKQLGITGIQSLYWLRFLNVPLMALVVLLGYLAARAIVPDRVELRLGVPLLLAVIPQSVFCALNNDVLSPVCCGALYLCVLRWLEPAPPVALLGGLTGLAMAAAYLTKLSNVPMIIVAAVALVPRLLQMFRQKPAAGFVALAGILFLGAIPIGIWMAWLALHFGDVTGSAAKIAFLDWTPKPLASWWCHPIFTPRGLWTFWSDLLASFWRGEVEWHHQLLDWPVADGFYVISSLVLLLGAVFGLWWKQSALSAFQREAMTIALLMSAAGIAFLALLSVQFDFGRCINPSREHLFHIGSIAQRRADSVCAGLCVRRFGPVPPNQRGFTLHCAGNDGRVCVGFGDQNQLARFRQPTQLVSPVKPLCPTGSTGCDGDFNPPLAPTATAPVASAWA